MPDFVALDWEKHELNGLEADVTRSAVRVHRCFCLAWPEHLAPDEEPEEAGRWLRSELKRLGVGARRALISLPRDEAVVRQFDVPDVSDEELPELVRLQAETKLSSSLDQLVIDFLPLPRVADLAVRPVLLVSISRQRLEQIRRIVEQAGLELAAVGMSSAATAELVARVEEEQGIDPDETSLTVTRDERRVEISLMRRRHLLFSHSMQLPGDDDRQDSRLILAEIRRSLGAHSRTDAGITVSRGWIIGGEDEHRTLSGMMTDQLDCEVGTIDPLAAPNVTVLPGAAEDEALLMLDQGGVRTHAPYAAPMGMLLASRQPTVEAVDFLNPRRAVERVDRRKLKIGLAAAAVVLIAGSTFGGMTWYVGTVEADIDVQQDKLARLEERITKGQPAMEAAAAVSQWDDHRVDWLQRLDEVNRLLQVLPGETERIGTDRIYVSNFRFSPLTGSAAGHVYATGLARTRRDVEQVYQRLSLRNYGVQAHAINRTSKDPDYPYSFQLDLTIASSSADEKPTTND